MAVGRGGRGRTCSDIRVAVIEMVGPDSTEKTENIVIDKTGTSMGIARAKDHAVGVVYKSQMHTAMLTVCTIQKTLATTIKIKSPTGHRLCTPITNPPQLIENKHREMHTRAISTVVSIRTTASNVEVPPHNGAFVNASIVAHDTSITAEEPPRKRGTDSNTMTFQRRAEQST